MSGDADYKLCPECRQEYRLEALRCIDCHVDLVHPHELGAEDAATGDFPPAEALECVRVAPLAWMRALSTMLQNAGIAHRVEPARAEDAPEDQRPDVFGDVELFGLYVESENRAPAREIDGSIAGQLLPEEAPALVEGEMEECPACGARLAADAVECPDCGLGFA